MIAIVDYETGNLRSVAKAFEFVGAKVKITQNPDDILKSDKVVVPGVGAFKVAIEKLKALKLDSVIKDVIKGGKPYLGICLGLQLLFDESEEAGSKIKGIGIFKGKVTRFSKLKVPHMGWNQINIKNRDSRLFENIPEKSFMYFCHSYYVEPLDVSIIAATTDYGKDFTSAISKDNISGVQFHPEKSQGLGLKVLENFLRS